MNREEKDRIAAALGAARVVDVGTKTIRGPLDLLALREEFGRRLQSSGGRPTDPTWTVSRQVPFKDESWIRLQGLADEVGVTGRRVGPAQVAALLIENSLEELEDREWLDALEGSRRLPLLSQPDAAEAAHVTYNQLDDWMQRGWILPASRRGRQRSFSVDEVIRAQWLRSISQTPVDIETASTAVRATDLAARYLVIANTEAVTVASTRSQLFRILETSGSHLVLDQLPERRRLLGLPPHPDGAHDAPNIRRAV